MAYTNDYSGLGTDNYALTLAHSFQLAEGHSLRLGYTRQMSGDGDATWGGSDPDSYDHFRVGYSTSWKDFNINLAAEDTDDVGDWADADSRVVLSVSKTFAF